MRKSWRLVASISLCELAGLVGSVFTAPAIPGWYAGLMRPEWAPPSWLFAPVWILLYALMGLAVFLVGEKGWGRKEVQGALGVFGVSLVLNVLWSVIFFGLQDPGAAFVEIILLWISILAAILAFAPLSKWASWLLVPYLLWVSFAAYLNYSIWQLN